MKTITLLSSHQPKKNSRIRQINQGQCLHEKIISVKRRCQQKKKMKPSLLNDYNDSDMQRRRQRRRSQQRQKYCRFGVNPTNSHSSIFSLLLVLLLSYSSSFVLLSPSSKSSSSSSTTTTTRTKRAIFSPVTNTQQQKQERKSSLLFSSLSLNKRRRRIHDIINAINTNTNSIFFQKRRTKRNMMMSRRGSISSNSIGSSLQQQQGRRQQNCVTNSLNKSNNNNKICVSNSPLFRTQSASRISGNHHGSCSRSSSSTSLNMVLTTPESIFEEASTESLLDDLINECVRTSARRPIMMQFDPSSKYIWRRWSGTVFSETWISCVKNMIYSIFVVLLLKYGMPIDQKNLITKYLNGFNTLWSQLLSITTFTLTFFLNQSYALWRKCYELSRRLQGRLNDLGLTLAAHAERKDPLADEYEHNMSQVINKSKKLMTNINGGYSYLVNDNDDSIVKTTSIQSNADILKIDPDLSISTYTTKARQLLELVSRYIRLFNLLTYASFTRSHRPILTPKGMRRLVDRGLMTSQEREILISAEIPATQRHNAVLLWIVRLFIEGRKNGSFRDSIGFEQQFLEKVHVIRAQYGAIGDELQGRMPLAYAHIVQVLVDVILWMYPIMAYTVGMAPVLSILGTGLLTMFYQGLFDLAKQFLDPYDNENYGKGEDPLCVDTLVAETNAGSVRWMYGFEQQPFTSSILSDSTLLSDYLLPLRGYSVEQLKAEEKEKAEKEKEQIEQQLLQMKEMEEKEMNKNKEEIKSESKQKSLMDIMEKEKEELIKLNTAIIGDGGNDSNSDDESMSTSSINVQQKDLRGTTIVAGGNAADATTMSTQSKTTTTKVKKEDTPRQQQPLIPINGDLNDEGIVDNNISENIIIKPTVATPNLTTIEYFAAPPVLQQLSDADEGTEEHDHGDNNNDDDASADAANTKVFTSTGANTTAAVATTTATSPSSSSSKILASATKAISSLSTTTINANKEMKATKASKPSDAAASVESTATTGITTNSSTTNTTKLSTINGTTAALIANDPDIIGMLPNTLRDMVDGNSNSSSAVDSEEKEMLSNDERKRDDRNNDNVDKNEINVGGDDNNYMNIDNSGDIGDGDGDYSETNNEINQVLREFCEENDKDVVHKVYTTEDGTPISFDDETTATECNILETGGNESNDNVKEDIAFNKTINEIKKILAGDKYL